MRNLLFKRFNIIPINKDLFYSKKINRLGKVLGREPDSFWAITATRLIYIENFIKARNLTNVYCFENDVLLYYNLKEYHEIFSTSYEYLGITPGGDTKCMTGFMFIKNWEAMALMTQFFIDILEEHGIELVMEHYGMEMLHEMCLMRAYGKEVGDNYLTDLPILPTSKDFELFGSIFDSAAWGQYVGGTRAEGPGAKPIDHYVSQVLIANPDFDVIWKKNDVGRKMPYLSWTGEDIRINNLHIHSKNLHKYISK